jgi:hypothetical protein
MWRTRYQPDAASLSKDICAAIARISGGAEWSSSEPELRQAARERGRRAAEFEARWQVQRILSYVSLAYNGSNAFERPEQE